MNHDILPYLGGWERIIIPGSGDIATFKHGDFLIHLIGKHDIRLTGKNFSGEMRFYQAAVKVMELEEK
jgi:hypothetical protein